MDQPRDKMDRKRLKEIEQSDLTEGRLNQDFVDWLKTKGPNYLLIILAAICVYMVIVRWKQHGLQKSAEAWQALATADLPRSLEDVAEEYPGEDSVPTLARMSAAKRYLQSVRAGTTVSAAAQQQPTDPSQPAPPPPATEPLSDEQRAEYLKQANRLFQTSLDALNKEDQSAPGVLLLKVNALEGLAAVAEAQGDAETATKYYKQAAQAAGTDFPKLAEQADDRESNVDATVKVAALPTIAEAGGPALRQNFSSTNPSDIKMSPSLQGIISGEDEAAGDDDAAQPSAFINTSSGSE